MVKAPLDELLVPHVEAWRAWLERHHGSSPGVILVLHKAGGSVTGLTYDQALDEALCVGWIDGQTGRRDEASYTVRMTPRTKRSIWSQRNTELVARLTEQGRMRPAGLAAVEAARADGRWDAAYSRQSEIEPPDDLVAAIAAEPAASAMWAVLTRTNRFVVIHRVTTVKRAETRERKIREAVAMLARHEAPFAQKSRPDG